MIKAPIFSLGLFALLAAATVSHSQVPGQDVAIQEGIRRQAARITLREKLANARDAEARRDLVTAAKLYTEGWALTQQIGAGVEQEREVSRAGIANVRLELARAAQHRGDLRGAARQVDDVLFVDPTNAAALSFKAGNDKLLAQQQGKIPSEEVVALVPGVMADKVKTNTKVQDAKLLFEMGKLDESEASLKEAIKEDLQNKTAYWYLNMIKE